MSAVACGSCAAPAAGSTGAPAAGATGLPGAVAEFAAAGAVTGPACAGMLRPEPGAAARVPVAHAVASAPTATMPAPALQILLLMLRFRLIACLHLSGALRGASGIYPAPLASIRRLEGASARVRRLHHGKRGSF